MPRRKGRGKKKGNKKRAVGHQGPPNGATAYSGPAMLRPRSTANDTEVVRLTYFQSSAAGITGGLTQQISNNPAGATEWPSWVTLWQEYRVLAQTVQWQPVLLNFTPSAILGVLTYGPCLFYTNRDASIATVSGFDAAFQNAESKLRHIQQATTMVIRAGTSQEMLFKTTLAPSAQWTWNLTFPLAYASQTYGFAFVTWLVQFRGRY